MIAFALLIKAQTHQQHFQHAAKQSYIGLGYATIAAENVKADTTPMVGFSPDTLNEFLELKRQGLKVLQF